MIASWNNQIEAHKEANRRADAILAEEQKQFQAVIDANKRVRTGRLRKRKVTFELIFQRIAKRKQQRALQSTELSNAKEFF